MTAGLTSTTGGGPVPATATDLDDESAAWRRSLAAGAPERDAAMARLHALLLRAARFEVSRRAGALGERAGRELDDLAMQAADDALLAVLRKLDSYRGDSRFTTWAYKFALLEAAVKVRRRSWRDREVPLEDAAWERISDRRASPHDDAHAAELLSAIRRAIEDALTAHQRSVLVAITLNDVPIDVLAERLGTTRGALYKTLHDARRKLRAALAAGGHDVGEAREGASA
ncbi:MAG: hypothetical protein QOE65_1948 [Solirubrobacteraceae bacterium]|nr:hypothetical protein [Solirubrobacteraceae bacterium]